MRAFTIVEDAKSGYCEYPYLLLLVKQGMRLGATMCEGPIKKPDKRFGGKLYDRHGCDLDDLIEAAAMVGWDTTEIEKVFGGDATSQDSRSDT